MVYFFFFFNYHLKKFVHPLHSQLLIPTHPAKVFHPLSVAGCQVNTLCGCALSGGGMEAAVREQVFEYYFRSRFFPSSNVMQEERIFPSD